MVKKFACQCRRYRRCRFDPWVGKIPLEKEAAAHTSILAWEILWTEQPGGRQSMGSELDTAKRLSMSTAQHKELYSVLCGDLNGKEIHGRGDICLCVADSLCSAAATNTTL